MPVSRERLHWLVRPALIITNTVAALALIATAALIWLERGWVSPDTSRWWWKAQLATRVFTFLVFAITLVALRGGAVRTLGVVFIGTVVAALLIRGWAHVRAARTMPG